MEARAGTTTFFVCIYPWIPEDTKLNNVNANFTKTQFDISDVDKWSFASWFATYDSLNNGQTNQAGANLNFGVHVFHFTVYMRPYDIERLHSRMLKKVIVEMK